MFEAARNFFEISLVMAQSMSLKGTFSKLWKKDHHPALFNTRSTPIENPGTANAEIVSNSHHHISSSYLTLFLK